MNITATLFGQMITFAVLVWFVNRVLWQPLTVAMAQRTRRIEEGLEAGERGRQREETAQSQAVGLIREARDKAAEIVAQAHERQAEIVEGAKREAQAERKRIIAAAAEEIEHEINRAREELRKELAALVVAGTERLVGERMDSRRDDLLIDDLAARI